MLNKPKTETTQEANTVRVYIVILLKKWAQNMQYNDLYIEQ